MATATRIGQGFDLHRLVPGLPLMLGGLPVPWDKGSQGHSDGDVILHALCDALLGAAGLGDIGDWFPPSDPQWKGASSDRFVMTVVSLLKDRHWSIVNVDVTVMLEAPKLGELKSLMKVHIAQMLGLPTDCVSIKAKTMEGLGPIGQSEAVAATVVALLKETVAS